MLLDGYLVFSSAQALTATAASTNIFDLQNARDMGIGDQPALKFFVSTGTAFLSTGSSTLVVTFEGSTDASTWDIYASFPSIAKAALVASKRIINGVVPRVAFGFTLPRYLRLNYTVGVADFTAGTLNAAIVLDNQEQINYSAGLYVSN